jgi:DNA-binding XRE family transcriptional regulator
MARSVEAKVKPELIIWARKSIGYDQVAAAKKVGVTVDRLIEWEAGDSKKPFEKFKDHEA